MALDSDSIMGTTVEQIMSPDVVTVELDAAVAQLIGLMATHDFACFPVIDREKHVRGVVARDDLVRALARSTWHTSLPLDLHPIGYAIT